jgi:hypothetical protein
MELFELDGELPLMMMVGSVDLLEVQLVGLSVEPSRTLQVRRPRSGQVHMRNSEQERKRTIAQVWAVELVPQLAEEEHKV